MPQIDYFFAVNSPFTYLAGTRLERIAARHGATVAYRPVNGGELITRAGGTRYAGRSAARKEYQHQDMARIAAREGLPIIMEPARWPANAAPAAYAIIAATAAGGGDLGALVHGLCRAGWAEGRDIADDAVIRDCLTAAGFDPGLAEKGLWTAAETYEKNLEEALARGVFGLPFYIAEDDARFWGQDRLADLDLHLSGRG